MGKPARPAIRKHKVKAVELVKLALEIDAATMAAIAILRLRDGLSMAEYQRRAVKA